MTGYVGDSVRLSVDISNFEPLPQIAWMYRGSSKLLGTDPKYTVLPQGVIQISNIGTENKGQIRAIARNTVDGSQMRGKFVSVNVLPGLSSFFVCLFVVSLHKLICRAEF